MIYLCAHISYRVAFSKYLQANHLSDGQDKAWHKTLNICDIMSHRVNLQNHLDFFCCRYTIKEIVCGKNTSIPPQDPRSALLWWKLDPVKPCCGHALHLHPEPDPLPCDRNHT